MLGYCEGVDVGLRSSSLCIIDEQQGLPGTWGASKIDCRRDTGQIYHERFDDIARQAKTAYPTLTEALGPLLEARDHRYRAFLDIDKRARTIAHEDSICQLIMSATGAGVVAALTLKATVDNPKRFRRSKTVVAHFGLMPQKVSVGRAGQSWHILEAG